MIKPIRIIVKNGNATLDGVVDSEADKNLVICGYSQVLQLASFQTACLAQFDTSKRTYRLASTIAFIA
jgi:hypothetical protein